MNDRHSETERPLRPVRDLAGIHVRDASGVTIGSIWGSLADAHTGLIRYLDVALDDPPRHVLVPIGHARLRAMETTNGGVTRAGTLSDAHELRLRAALLEELTAIPAYTPAGNVDEGYEHALLRAHGQLFHGERYYAHPAFDHRGFYAGPHPLAREPGEPADSGLQPLRRLRGYRLAREEPDVRGCVTAAASCSPSASSTWTWTARAWSRPACARPTWRHCRPGTAAPSSAGSRTRFAARSRRRSAAHAATRCRTSGSRVLPARAARSPAAEPTAAPTARLSDVAWGRLRRTPRTARQRRLR